MSSTFKEDDDMTWRTHKHGAFSATLLLYPLVLMKMHILGLAKQEYLLLALLAYIILFNGALYGTIFPDLDHGNPKSIPSRNAFTSLINKVMHMGPIKVSHRSWQTHSCDLYLIVVGIPIYFAFQQYIALQSVIYLLVTVLLMGFMGGALIHCFMDMFTIQGVWVSIILAYLISGKKGYKKHRISLAPTWFWYPFFSFQKGFHRVFPVPEPITGGEYEKGFRTLIGHLNRLYLVASITIFLKPWWMPYAQIIVGYIQAKI